MSPRRLFLASLSLIFCTSFFLTASSGQEGAGLPELGVEMTYSGKSMPVTPAIIERGNVLKPDLLELQYLLPLRWELEKHGIYRDLMQRELAELDGERVQAIKEQEKIADLLTDFGATSMDQLDEKQLALQESKLESAILETEATALRDAIEQRKASVAGQDGRKAKEAVMLQQKLVELAERKKQQVKEQYERNSASLSQALEAETEVIRARRELALMEAEANQQSDAIVNALLSRLAEIEPRKKATAAKTERLAEISEKSAQIRQLVHQSQRAERKQDLLEERKSQLTARLREQKLRTDYLEQVLDRYEQALKKAVSRDAAGTDGT